jgi:hypothetical protein
MADRPAWRQSEIDARKKLVSTAERMIAGELSFLEGAYILCGLEHKVGGVKFPDADFGVFTGIVSESDHLPFEAQRPLWNPEALARMEPEIKEKEAHARSIAMQACKNLIARFGGPPTVSGTHSI